MVEGGEITGYSLKDCQASEDKLDWIGLVFAIAYISIRLIGQKIKYLKIK